MSLKEKTKDVILNEAMNIAHTEGLSKISMRKIANNCNIGLGTIYNYYPTKDDIILDLVEKFWSCCFEGFDDVCKDDLDFFKTMENIYFHMLNYLNRFKKHCLEYMSELPLSSKSKGKTKEGEFLKEIIYVFVRIYNKHKNEFRSDIDKEFDSYEVSRFILDNMFAMLKRFECDYTFFDLALRKILL